MKECTICKKELDSDNFYSSNWSECISCLNKKSDAREERKQEDKQDEG